MPEKQNIDKRVGEIAGDVADVKIAAAQLPEIENLDTAKNVASTTTAEEDRKAQGQRDINLIWETTQRLIAIFVIIVSSLVSSIVVVGTFIRGNPEPNALTLASFTLLSNISFLVAGFYFGRTNHARIGDGAVPLDDRWTK